MEILNLVNEVYLRKEMCAAARVDFEHVKYLLLGRLRNLRTVKEHTLLCGIPLQLLERLLVATPLVRDELTAFKATHRDNQSC